MAEELVGSANGEYGLLVNRFLRPPLDTLENNRMANLKQFLTYVDLGAAGFGQDEWRWHNKNLLYTRVEVNFGVTGNIAFSCSDVSSTGNTDWKSAAVFNASGQYCLAIRAYRRDGVTTNKLSDPIHCKEVKSHTYSPLARWNTFEIYSQVTTSRILTGNPWYTVPAYERIGDGADLQHIYCNGTYLGTFPWRYASIRERNFPAQFTFWTDSDWSQGKPSGWDDPTTGATNVRKPQSHVTGYDVNGTPTRDPWVTTPDAMVPTENKVINYYDPTRWKFRVYTNGGTWRDFSLNGNDLDYAYLFTDSETRNSGGTPNIESRLVNINAWEGFRGSGTVRIRVGIEWRNTTIGGNWSAFSAIAEQDVQWDNMDDHSNVDLTVDVTDETTGLSSFEQTAFNNHFTGTSIKCEFDRW